MTPALEVRLRHRAGPVLLDVDLRVAGTTVVVGPNGAGKSTLLRLILGVRRPEAGLVRQGTDVHFDAEAGIDRPPEHRALGYLPQDCGLFPHLTVIDNVAFGLPRTLSRVERRAVAREHLAAHHLLALGDRRPGHLSGGERQRVALARALAAGPRALLLDEPLSALDASSRRRTRAFLAETLARTGLPALVVTHDLPDATALAHTIVVLEAGAIVQTGTLEDLRAAPATPYVDDLVSSGG